MADSEASPEEIQALRKYPTLRQQWQETPAVAAYYFGRGRKTLPETITVYRATDAGEIKPGDYVSVDRRHARAHMRSSGYQIQRLVVTPDDLRVVGTSGERGQTEFLYLP